MTIACRASTGCPPGARPDDRRLPRPDPRLRADQYPGPPHRPDPRSATALIALLPRGSTSSIPGNPRAVHRPDVRRAARRRARSGSGAGSPLGCIVLHRRDRPARVRRGQARARRILGRVRRLPVGFVLASRDRRPAGGARLGPEHARRHRRDAHRQRRDLRGRRAVARRDRVRRRPRARASSRAAPVPPLGRRQAARSPRRRSRPRGGSSGGGPASAEAPPDGSGLRAGPADVVDGGFYGPGSEAWRLNREAMLLLGAGPRALLLQIAHPLVAAGVAEHSDFRTDPWARLPGTLRSLPADRLRHGDAARGEIRRLNELHRGSGGRPRPARASAWHRYSALRPRARAVGPRDARRFDDRRVRRLDRAAVARPSARRYYEETLPVGRASGSRPSLLPPTSTHSRRTWPTMLAPGGPIEVGDVARELADAILHPPLGPASRPPGRSRARCSTPSRRAYAWLFWPSIGLLPRVVREGYGLPWGVRQRVVAAWLVATWQAWRPLLPPPFRQMPQALRGRSARRGRNPLLHA